MLGGDVRRHRAEFSGLTVCYQDISGVRAGEVRSGGRSGRGVDLGDLTMENSSDNQGGWREDGPTEPPADLLRRALSHVEDLLGRLEYPAVKQGELEPLLDEQFELDGEPAPDAVEAGRAEVQVLARDQTPVPPARDRAGREQDEAWVTADAILSQARRDAQILREQGRADAEQLTQAAAVEAERTLASAESLAAERVS